MCSAAAASPWWRHVGVHTFELTGVHKKRLVPDTDAAVGADAPVEVFPGPAGEDRLGLRENSSRCSKLRQYWTVMISRQRNQVSAAEQIL